MDCLRTTDLCVGASLFSHTNSLSSAVQEWRMGTRDGVPYRADAMRNQRAFQIAFQITLSLLQEKRRGVWRIGPSYYILVLDLCLLINWVPAYQLLQSCAIDSSYTPQFKSKLHVYVPSQSVSRYIPIYMLESYITCSNKSSQSILPVNLRISQQSNHRRYS